MQFCQELEDIQLKAMIELAPAIGENLIPSTSINETLLTIGLPIDRSIIANADRPSILNK
jgi:hypothetical protein